MDADEVNELLHTDYCRRNSAIGKQNVQIPVNKRRLINVDLVLIG